MSSKDFPFGDRFASFSIFYTSAQKLHYLGDDPQICWN
jgi:hypothetical protein